MAFLQCKTISGVRVIQLIFNSEKIKKEIFQSIPKKITVHFIEKDKQVAHYRIETSSQKLLLHLGLTRDTLQNKNSNLVKIFDFFMAYPEYGKVYKDKLFYWAVQSEDSVFPFFFSECAKDFSLVAISVDAVESLEKMAKIMVEIDTEIENDVKQSFEKIEEEKKEKTTN